MNKNTWLTILNPYAGSGRTMSVWMDVETLLQQKKVAYKTVNTASGLNVMNLAYKAAADGYRRILGVGGDGTVHDIVDGIIHYINDVPATRLDEFTISVIPLGSGNDWLKTLGLPTDVKSAVERLAVGNTLRQDVGLVTLLESGQVHPFINVAGVGFDARICEIVNDEKRHGIRRNMIYLQAVLRTVFRYKGMNLSINVDGHQLHSGPCYTISVGNGIYSGGGLRQTPGAVINDGLLDVMYLPKISFPLVVRGLPKLLTDKFTTVDGVESRKFQTMTVRPTDNEYTEIIEADGEVIGHLPARFELFAGQINVIV